MREQSILTFKIDIKEPIRVDELAESLKAIGKLYSQSIGKKGVIIKISEVRKGSYEFDFIATVFSLMENINIATEFIENIKGFFSKGKIDDNSQKPNNLQTKYINKIIRPIINITGNGNTINFRLNDNNSFTIKSKPSQRV